MLTKILIAVTSLFALGLIIRRFYSKKFCVLCASIALTWLSLFILYKTDRYHDTVLLSLLMGQSITGFYYFVEKRVPKVLKIFTLPFFLSLTAVAYMLITAKIIMPAFLVLTVLWIVGWLIFIYRGDQAQKPIAKAVMECCE